MTRAYWKEYSAFFRLTEHDLRVRLHGWLEPPPLLDEPRLLRGFIPFTKQPSECWSRVPDQPESGQPDAVRHPDLSPCAWLSTEGLQPNDMATLTRLLLSCSEDAANDHWGRFLAGPEDANDILQPVSPELVRTVSGLSEAALEEAASAWLAAAEVQDMAEGWSRRVLAGAKAFFAQSPNARYFFWTCR